MTAPQKPVPDGAGELRGAGIDELFERDDLFTARAICARLRNFGYSITKSKSVSPFSPGAAEPDDMRSGLSHRPPEAPEWLWYGEVDGKPRISYGRWPKNGAVWRYKWAETQPTEHDHPRSTRQDFEKIIASLNYDGADIDGLTVGEIRRALRSAPVPAGSISLAEAAIERQKSAPNIDDLAADLVAAGETESLAAPPVKDREAIARLIYDAGQPSSPADMWKEARRVADAILSLPVQPGAGEREPTPAMRIAGGIAWTEAFKIAETFVDCADACWKAMWDAR